MTTPGPAPVTPRVELPDVRAEPALTALMPGRATIADAQAAARGGDTVLGAPPATPARRTRLVIALGLLALVGAGIGAAVALGDDDASPAALPGAGATSSAGAATDARPAPPLADAAPPPPFDAPRAPIPPDATPSGAAPDAASTPTPDAGLASPGIPPSKPPAKPPAKPPSKPPTKPPTKPGCDPKDILNCRDPRKR